MMQMLAAGGLPILADERRVADPDNPRGYFEFEPATRLARDASWLSRADGRAFKLVYALLRELPSQREYRVILMRRRLAEVVASQGAMLERRGAPRSELPDERWIELFARELREVETWLRSQPNFALRIVDYNALIEEPRATAEAVRDFVAASLDVDSMARCVEPALYRRRLPLSGAGERPRRG
ncbi:MAG: sulfotransferase family protein [Deltaproteobacteria bacterium]|nr:MAG: sulfotransferase family protein [Deltaproteobacteria bacterium]